jgi:beta-glucuronidase
VQRRIAAIALACAAAAVPAARAAAADVPASKVLYRDGHADRFLLDGEWLFRLDPQDQGIVQGLQTQTSTDGWSKTTVPNAWNAGDDSPESQRGTVGWYRKDFSPPPGGPPGARYVIRFEAANYRATVFLNGVQIGTHEGGYVPFEVPADRLSAAGVNRLVVRVDSRRSDTDLPPLRDSELTGLPGGGWWNYGGLLREVYLRRYDRVDIEELHVQPVLDARMREASVRVEAVLRNAPGGRRKVRLNVRVGGETAASRPVSVPSDGRRTVSARLTLERPRLWQPARPALYPVQAEVTASGRTLSRYDTHVGIRRIEIDEAGRLRLNGRRLALRGASMHEDHPIVGAALTPGNRRRMFAELRRLGANVTRAHYPLHPELLELADRAGILVWEQIPFYRLRESQIPFVREKGLDYLEAMVRRDRNHPSVLAWSVANELSRDVEAGQQRYLREALDRIERLDPTRLSAIDIAGYPSVRLVPAYRRFDAIGVNSYFGWYPGPVGSVLNREVLSPYLDQLHDYYRHQALFITEFGAEANRSGPADEKGTFDFQREFMRYHLELYDSKPYLNGAIAWVLQDFKVRPGWDGYNRKPSPPYNKKGLLDERGQRKPAYADVQRLFQRAIARGGRATAREQMRAAPPLAEYAQVEPPAAFQPDRARLLAIFRTLEFGEKAYLSGQFRHMDDPDAPTVPYADRLVILEEAPYPHTAWTEAARTTTDQEGYFFFTRMPGLNTRYRVRTDDPPVTSEEPIVRVRLDVELETSRTRIQEGRRLTLSGTATPAHPGATVIIQRKDDQGRLVTIARTRLEGDPGAPSSTFEKRLKAKKTAEYAIRVLGDADHLPGTSDTLKVTVVPKRR